MLTSNERNQTDGTDIQLGSREWLGALLPLGALLAGAAGTLGITYWLLVGGLR